MGNGTILVHLWTKIGLICVFVHIAQSDLYRECHFSCYWPLSSNFFSGVGEERSSPRLPFRGLPGCLRPSCGMAEVGTQVSATFSLVPTKRNPCRRGSPQWESIILFATICHWRSAFWLNNSVAFTGWPSLPCLWIFLSLAKWIQDIHSLRL